MKKWIYRVCIAIGIIALIAIIWFAGPLIGVGDVRPLEGFWVRFIIVSLILLITAIVVGIKFWRRRKAAKALEEALIEQDQDTSDGQVLSEKMQDALNVLKASSGKSNFLYDLPWYVIIGPPGAGKTTALKNSGLKWPNLDENGVAAIAGTGGTRYCDWWFSEEAVLIDTAGRYTTQDSDETVDKKSWLSFLELLKKNRPQRPINGVIVAISVEDLLKLSDDELATHSAAIRSRLLEINKELKVDFPVYALFTKADLLSGFMEYFGNFTPTRRNKVWGCTFQTTDRKANMIREVPAEFDALVKRLSDEVTDRMHEEPDPVSRIAIFGFPEQFALLKSKVGLFLTQIFEESRYQANANLRGFYFASGTQEGTAIDQVLGVMSRSFGRTGDQGALSGKGKSFFLNGLLKDVMFAEAGWVGFDFKAVRRTAIIRYGSIAVLLLVSTGLLSAWGWSFWNNRELIASVDRAVDGYHANGEEELSATSLSDPDLLQVAGLLQQLRDMPVGYGNRNAGTPLGETFGLSQRERLVAASKTSYRHALERMFRSRLILRLERQIETFMNQNDSLAVYETLKVYLMLGGKAPKVDRDLIIAWMAQDWELVSYPGPQNKQARQELAQHLRAMLELDVAQRPSFELNGPLIESAQRALARMNMADQAYALVKSAAYSANIEDFNVAFRGGPDSQLVFETVDGSDFNDLRVPMMYTYAGFHQFFLEQLAAVAEKLEAEQWVLGEFGEQTAIGEQFKRLGPALLNKYAKEFQAEWKKVLDNIKLRPLSADKPSYSSLAAASSPTSPILSLFEAIKTETELTKDVDESGSAGGVLAGEIGSEIGEEAAALALHRVRSRARGLSSIGLNVIARKSQNRAGSSGSGSGATRIPGANIESLFKPYKDLFYGQSGQRAADALVASLYEVYKNLVAMATNPSQAELANNNLQLQVANLRASASRLPRPLARMINSAVNDFEGDAANTSLAQLNQMLASTVTRVCRQVVNNRYPFSRGSSRDVPMGDFARLFAPNGIIDRFFAQNLASYADLSGKDWKWKQDSRLGRELSRSTIREFQRASEIRDAFFAQGGSMPAVNLTISHHALHGEVESALLNVNGQVLQTQQVGNLPLAINWPGSLGAGSVRLDLAPEFVGRSSTINIEGPWAFMRMVASGSPKKKGDIIQVTYPVGGRYAAYKVRVGSVKNPFYLNALSSFKCPSGL